MLKPLFATLLLLTLAPAAMAQEDPMELPSMEDGVAEEMAAPSMSPSDIKKQLQGLQSQKSELAGVQDLARIARAIKANKGQMTLQDVKTLRTVLLQTRTKGSASQNPLYADMLEQLDGALGRLEKQIANPDGWDEEEMPTE